MENIQHGLSFSDTDAKGGFLDLLVIIAENVKLLVMGTLAVGLSVLVISFLVPQTYQSVAVLQADQSTASLMVTTAVLDPVIASLGLAKSATVEDTRIQLRQQIKITVGRNDKLLTLTVSGRTAQQSQALAAEVLRHTFLESRPKGNVRARLDVQLIEARVRLKNAQSVAENLQKRLELSSTTANAVSDVARGYAELLSATGAAQSQVSALESQLEGLSEAQLVQSPTLPVKPSQPKKALITIGAVFATGLALLLFIFVRESLRKTTVNETNSAKWLRIRNSLGLN